MKGLAIAICWFLAAPSKAHGTALKYPVAVTSRETLGLFYFMESLMEFPSRSRHLREIFFKERGDLEADREALEKLRNALKSAPDGFNFYPNRQDIPKGRFLGANMRDLIETAALHSSGLEDFSARIQGIFPVSQMAQLMQSLTYFSPIYREMIWRKSFGFLSRAVRDLKRTARLADMEETLGQAARFYGSAWPESQTFTVALVPVPVEHSHETGTFAHSMGPLEIVEVLQNDDLSVRYGVIFHELCHSLYEAQPLAFQNQIETWFQESRPGVAKAAYWFFDEALATAVGNGYAYLKVSKDRDSRVSWYNDEIVDGFAKAIFPLVARYIGEARSMDKNFVEESISLFRKKFPDVLSHPRFVFLNVHYIMEDERFAPKTPHSLAKILKAHSVQSYSPLDHEKNLQRYEQNPETTVLFAVSAGGLAKLRRYKGSRLPLDAIQKQARGRAGFFIHRSHTGRLHVVLIGRGEKDILSLLQDLKTMIPMPLGKFVPMKSSSK